MNHMTWYQTSQLRCEAMGLYDKELFRHPLRSHLLRNFKEYDARQTLLFNLTMEDLVESIVDRVLRIPIHFEKSEWTGTHKPSGEFDAETMSINICGVDYRRYDKDRSTAGYSSYLDAVIFHELVHAVNYLKGLWKQVAYNPFDMGKKYYGDPEEARAYRAMQVDFLQRHLGLRPEQVARLVNRYTTDPSDVRRQYLELYNRQATSAMARNRMAGAIHRWCIGRS
jgi:hypothetical protein